MFTDNDAVGKNTVLLQYIHAWGEWLHVFDYDITWDEIYTAQRRMTTFLTFQYSLVKKVLKYEENEATK